MSESKIIDINQILTKLPHRYPFALLDRITDYEVGHYLVGYKNVTINEPFFQGHFPGQPIMPGVLQLEALAQAAVMLAHISLPEDETKKYLHLFAGVDNARFKKPVIPGDRLELRVEFLGQKRSIWKMHGEATVNGKLACIADLMSATKDINQ